MSEEIHAMLFYTPIIIIIIISFMRWLSLMYRDMYIYIYRLVTLHIKSTYFIALKLRLEYYFFVK